MYYSVVGNLKKMKQIIFTLTFLIGISLIGSAQSSVDLDETIGFDCGEAGSQSKVVQKVSKLIQKEKFNSIVLLLDSKNNAEKYLAVLVCEKLVALNKLNLTKAQNEKIAEIYKSNEIITVCSGCKYEEKLTLKNLLKKESLMRSLANNWLDDLFETE